jgi:hypothetical protein
VGYTTDFWGSVAVEPPLSPIEVFELQSFIHERHGSGTPGDWCRWEPSEDGSEIHWDEGKKFYESVPWMQYIIDYFLAPAGHVVNGTIDAQGEDPDDRWRLVVRDNTVHVQEARLLWPSDDDRGYL